MITISYSSIKNPPVFNLMKSNIKALLEKFFEKIYQMNPKLVVYEENGKIIFE